MLRPRWRKVIRDLFYNRTRTALVVLSIAVGVFAFGTILATRVVISEQLRSSFLAINPVSATITTEPFDDELVEAARNLPSVAEAEGARMVTARIQTGPFSWQEAQLFVLPDDGETRIGIVKPWQGAWPPPDRAVLIERSSFPKLNAAVGDTLRIELPGQQPRELPLAGTTHDLSLPPAAIAGTVAAYVTSDTLEWLGGPAGYNQLQIVVREGRDDAEQIRLVAEAVERVVERSGREVVNTDVPTPLQHPAEVVLPTVLLLLTTLGVLALLISTFLIINTISAILTQQTRQIGIMKAIGARSSQIAGLYFTLAGSFGLLALLIAVPLAAVASYFFTRFLGGQLNVDIVGVRMPFSVILTQAGAALLVSLVAAALPVRGVVRRPAREALAVGGSDLAVGRLFTPARVLAFLSRPVRLALRNTFRRKGRLARTLVALSLGGAVFISVLTLRGSLYTTLDASIASQRYDVELQLSQLYRTERVAALAASVPGVTHVESLQRATAFPLRPDGSTGEALSLRALPADTTLFDPIMASGRWLLPDDSQAVVLTTNYLSKEPGTQVGDSVTLRIGDEDLELRVVGFIDELIPPTSPAWAYLPIDAYTPLLGGVGRTDTLRIATANHDAASQRAVGAALEQRFEEQGFELRLIRTRSEDRAILDERFQLLTVVLTTMSLLIGTVGGLGLTGTMSINVLERTREIGVMRAIGATDRAVRQIVLSEGSAIAVLAWLIGCIVSLPLSYALCFGMGTALLGAPLAWIYSLPGAAIWLLIVLAIAIVASLVPARAAVRLTVREILAYE